jgi:methionine-gamma-lyase
MKVRMEKQQQNAGHVAEFLQSHPKVKKVNYLGLLQEGTKAYEIFKKQQNGPGAMLSFEVEGGEHEAFVFLNSLKLIKLAVSLGSTESLAEHPKTMTHAGVAPEHLDEMGISDTLIRLSVGVEHFSDIIFDIEQALLKIDI